LYFANHYDICPLKHNTHHRQIPLGFYSPPPARHARGLDEYSVPTPANKGPAGKEMTCIDSEKDGHGVDAAD
jgi:hypothetical protein